MCRRICCNELRLMEDQASDKTFHGFAKTRSKQPLREPIIRNPPSEGLVRGGAGTGHPVRGVKTCSKQPLREKNDPWGTHPYSPDARPSQGDCKNCRRGCLEDGQSPKGLLRGTSKNGGGPGRRGVGGRKPPPLDGQYTHAPR